MNEFLSEFFLDELFKCTLTKKSFLQVCIEYLKSNYLPDENYQKVWDEIVKQYNINDRVPTIGNLSLELRKDLKCLKILGKIRKIPVPDYESALNSFEQFIRQNRFIELYDKVGDTYNQEGKDKAYLTFYKGAEEMAKFTLKGASYDKIFGEFNKRHIHRISNREKVPKVPTCVETLTDKMDGGKQFGEFTMYLGDTGVGKSMLLIGEGISAARVGYRVAHFQAEGTRQQCLDRYDAAWVGALYRDIKIGEVEEERFKKAKKIVSSMGKGEIYVETVEKFGAISLMDVRNSLIAMNKLYGRIDVVILDYFELFNPGDGRKYAPSEERFRQTAISRGLKNLAVEFNIDITTATQSSSIPPEMLNDPDFVITRFNLSEDKGKIRAVDNFITINQTRDEKKNKTARLYLDKMREHGSGDTIHIAQNLARCRFYDRKRTMELFLNED